jgi:hypothetical protein
MAWAPYLFKEFVTDFLNAQDEVKEFHYSWVLLLLGMALWKPPPNFEIDMATSPSFLAPGSYRSNIPRMSRSRLPFLNHSSNGTP